jgi:hypothetical protein
MRRLKFIRKNLVSFFIALCLIFYYGIAQSGFCCQSDELKQQEEIKKEIQVINLINGLYLTQEQIDFLIKQIEKLNEKKKNFKEKYKRYASSLDEDLMRLKKELLEDETEVSKDLARQIHYRNRLLHKLREEYDTEIDKIVQLVKDNLTETQLHIIREFKPCLVPPKGPSRIGEIGNANREVKQLERIRNMSEEDYLLRKEEIASRIVERILFYIPKRKRKDIERSIMLEKILAMFDEVRTLSDIDFELSKEEIAKEFKAEIENLLPKRENNIDIEVKIKRFLLSPQSLSILKNQSSIPSKLSKN